MASKQAVQLAFQLLDRAGVRPPADPQGTAALWLVVMGDLEDRALVAAVAAYVREAATAFWPMPGAIRAKVPVETVLWSDGFAALQRAVGCGDLGSYGTKRLADYAFFEGNEAANRAVRAGVEAIGGLQAYRMSREGDQTVRAAFRDTFVAAMASSKTQSSMAMAENLLEGAGMLQIATSPGLRAIDGGKA